MGPCSSVRTWWAGTGNRSSRFSLAQALLGANVFLLLSHSFEATITDMYSPDVATLTASFGAGAVALLTLTSTQLVRASPLRASASPFHYLALSVALPVILMFSIRAPSWALMLAAFNALVCGLTWRRPGRRKSDSEPVKSAHLVAAGIKDDPERRMTKQEYNLMLWEAERRCFFTIALAFLAGSLHLFSQPFLLIMSTAILFGWLNAPVLLPPGTVTSVLLAVVTRVFHVVAAYNCDWLTSSVFVRDRAAALISITELDFWWPVLSSAVVMGAIPLGRLGIPYESVEKLLDDERYWIYWWRIHLLLLLFTFAWSAGFWAFTLIPLLKAVA